MIAALVLLAVLQEAPIAAEKERIAARMPLSGAERQAYALPPLPAAKPRTAYTLAVIPLEFSDRAPAPAGLTELFFGTVAGYYARASGDRFRLGGKVFRPVTLAVERERFERKDLEKALQTFLEREGPGALAAYEGVAFAAAGGLAAPKTALWPHSGRIGAAEYMLVPAEAGERGGAIVAHEFMHLLGFADKYDDEKASVGAWCILGTGYSVKAPPPPCADCRGKLGWTAAAAVDPSRESRVVLGADPGHSVKVAVNADASEYLLLEVRDRLFIWHAGGGRKIELLGRYPTETSDRLTPLSEPSFRGTTVGARPIWITDIRIEDGKAWFRVGPEAAPTPLEQWRKAHVGKRLGE